VAAIDLATFALQEKSTIMLNKVQVKLGAGIGLRDDFSWFHR
jgi:hypothetical protein